MHHFRTILCAADFSPGSSEAFRVACSLAHEKQSRIYVLFVAEPKYTVPEPSYVGQQPGPLEMVDREPSYYEAVKDHLREVYAPNKALDVEYCTAVGATAEQILHAAHEVHPDLIVMGTHGRTGLRRLLAGSVAETVLRHAPCPVLALRSAATAGVDENIRVVLHPTDFSDHTAESLRVARTLARDLGARLVLLSVMPGMVAAEGVVVAPADSEYYRAAIDELRARLNGPDLKFPVEAMVREGDAAAEILRAADDIHCGLIVMGTEGRTGLDRWLMGSVAEGVLRKAKCPALIVKYSRHEPVFAPAANGHKSVTVI